MNYTVLLGVWIAVALAVLALAVYRRIVASDEDDMLHVRDSEVKLNELQQKVDRKLTLIDRWGQALTVVAVVYGLALSGAFLYGEYVKSASQVLVSAGS
jgi:hypothetical protein